jgi:amidophosphoribosyltransferase
VRASINADSLGYVSEQGLIAATEQPANRLCTACFTGEYPIPLGEPEVLGKHVLDGIGRRTLSASDDTARAVSGWTGQQAGSPALAGGADDALSRP